MGSAEVCRLSPGPGASTSWPGVDVCGETVGGYPKVWAEMSAVAAFCEHDVIWGAYTTHSEDVRDYITAATEFLEPGLTDRLVVVPVDEVRVKLNPCSKCEAE